MKYGFTQFLFTLIFDRYAYACFRKEGIVLSKKKVHKEYKEMIRRTPALPDENPLLGNLLIGCYVLSFYKAYPETVNEELFRKLVHSLCYSKPMVNAHKKQDAFDEKVLLQKEKDAEASKGSSYEMDWQYAFQRGEGSYDLIYTRCGLCQLGFRENCSHLIRFLCEADFITYNLLGADLKRTQTIAEGGTCCDFHVERKEKSI